MMIITKKGKRNSTILFRIIRLLLLAAVVGICAPPRASTALVSYYEDRELYLTDYRYIIQDIFDLVETELWYVGECSYYSQFTGADMTVAVMPRTTYQETLRKNADFCVSFYGDSVYYIAGWWKSRTTLRGDNATGLLCSPGYSKSAEYAAKDLTDAICVRTMPGFTARRADFEIFYPERIDMNLRLVGDFLSQKYYDEEFASAEYARITYGYYRDGDGRNEGNILVLAVIEVHGKLFLHECQVCDYSGEGGRIYANFPQEPYPFYDEVSMEGEYGPYYEMNMHMVNRLWEENWRVEEFRYGERIEP